MNDYLISFVDLLSAPSSIQTDCFLVHTQTESRKIREIDVKIGEKTV